MVVVHHWHRQWKLPAVNWGHTLSDVCRQLLNDEPIFYSYGHSSHTKMQALLTLQLITSTKVAALRRCFDILANGVTTPRALYVLLYSGELWPAARAQRLKALTKKLSDKGGTHVFRKRRYAQRTRYR
jgi:hypothetical protein